jgi:hypothetical protein
VIAGPGEFMVVNKACIGAPDKTCTIWVDINVSFLDNNHHCITEHVLYATGCFWHQAVIFAKQQPLPDLWQRSLLVTAAMPSLVSVTCQPKVAASLQGVQLRE